MSTLIRNIEELLLPLISIVGIIISLADLFDVLRFMGDHIPMLTVLLISVALGSLVFVHHRCVELNKDVRKLLLKTQLEHMDMIVEHVDPNLRKVLDDDYFDDILAFFQIAIKDSQVSVNNEARFRHYYMRTLDLYPKATFLISCTSVTAHVWKDSVLDAMEKFILGGGKIRMLIFFKDMRELNVPTVKLAVARLQHRGIQILSAHYGSTPHELRKNFIVESKNKIAWEFHLEEEGKITASTVTTNKKFVEGYSKIFAKLRGSELRAITQQEIDA